MSDRRNFLTRLVGSFTATSVFGSSTTAAALPSNELDRWFEKIKGEQKIVFDSPSVHQGLQTMWAWTFLDSHNHTGTADNDMTAVVVFRHLAIGLALQDRLWKKYNLGKYFGIADPLSGTPATRNMFWDPPAGERPEEGMTIRNLQTRGVLFCVCEKAITNNSKLIARSKNLDEATVRKDMIEGLLPDIMVVPSGVWALQKAQHKGCAYCFAGGD